MAPTAPTRRTLHKEELVNVPGSLNDPIRVVQNLPGMNRAPYLAGALLVRGTPPTDTGLYLDGQRITILQWAGIVAVVIASIGATRAHRTQEAQRSV